jgi:hypothetical protein
MILQRSFSQVTTSFIKHLAPGISGAITSTGLYLGFCGLCAECSVHTFMYSPSPAPLGWGFVACIRFPPKVRSYWCLQRTAYLFPLLFFNRYCVPCLYMWKKSFGPCPIPYFFCKWPYIDFFCLLFKSPKQTILSLSLWKWALPLSAHIGGQSQMSTVSCQSIIGHHALDTTLHAQEPVSSYLASLPVCFSWFQSGLPPPHAGAEPWRCLCEASAAPPSYIPSPDHFL